MTFPQRFGRGSAGKYKNTKVKDDGYTFDSKAEHKRYGELKLMRSQGLICNLIVHKRYPILVNGEKVCTYIGDFEYQDQQLRMHVEDVKGVETDVFKLKAKLMKVVNGIDIELITKGRK
jgi:hypothetical protein